MALVLFRAMWGLPFTVTCPSADVTVRCCTARLQLHPLSMSARNLETNVTDRVANHSLFRFYAVHVYAFLLLFFYVLYVLSLHVSAAVCLSRLSQIDGTVCRSRLSDRRDRQIGHFHCPVMFRETVRVDGKQPLNLFYVNIHVKFPQIFTILRENSR